jgi:hypothetical protein
LKKKVWQLALLAALLICITFVTVSPKILLAQTQTENRTGAYYYSWYGIESNNHWKNDIKGTPFLGYYNSSDPQVADQQILLAKQHGIDFFAASWVGEGIWHSGDFSTIDKNLRSGLLQAPHLQDFNFSLFYETVLVKDNAYNEQQNFSAIFLKDIAYAANNYFDNPSYLRAGGDPVLFVYNVPYLYQNSTRQDVHLLLDETRQELARMGLGIYIIGDMGGAVSPQDVDPNWLYQMNSTTNYVYSNPAEGWNHILSDAYTYYPQWAATMNSEGIGFVPNVYPGFNNTDNSNVVPPYTVLPRNATAFAEMLNVARSKASNRLGIVMVTSWNEWMEETTTEPSMEEGELFLRVVLNNVQPTATPSLPSNPTPKPASAGTTTNFFLLNLSSLVLIIVGLASEKFFVGRLTTFANSMALDVFFVGYGFTPWWITLYLGFGTLLGLLGLFAYVLNESLPDEYYWITLVLYSSITAGLVMLAGAYIL